MLELFQKLFCTESEAERVERLLQARRMEAIGRLATGVAHDLNNVLSAICGYNDLLKREIAPNARLLHYTSEIEQAAERAGALTGQLLAFSRRQVTEPRVVDLNRIISDISEMLCRIVGDGVHLSTRLAPELKAVRVDPAQVDQILMNLAANARDAMPSGGKLAIETANVEVTAALCRRSIDIVPGSYVMLAISDTGTGMDADTKNRLFEPFFTTKECGKGTGLGLSIVYAIVKQNSGDIRVCSEPGKGTTMKIYLPAVASETAPPTRVLTAGASA